MKGIVVFILAIVVLAIIAMILMILFRKKINPQILMLGLGVLGIVILAGLVYAMTLGFFGV